MTTMGNRLNHSPSGLTKQAVKEYAGNIRHPSMLERFVPQEARVGALKEKTAETPKYRERSIVNGVEISVAWDHGDGEYTIYFPQLEVNDEAKGRRVLDQIIHIGRKSEIAEQVYDKAVELAETTPSPLDLYIKIEEFLRDLPKGRNTDGEEDPSVSTSSRFSELEDAWKANQKRLEELERGSNALGEAVRLEAKYQLIVDAAKKGIIPVFNASFLQHQLEKTADWLKNRAPDSDKEKEQHVLANMSLRLDDMIMQYELAELTDAEVGRLLEAVHLDAGKGDEFTPKEWKDTLQKYRERLSHVSDEQFERVVKPFSERITIHHEGNA